MQISAPSTITTPALATLSYSRINGQETAATLLQNAQIAYNDPGNSIVLSLSSRIDYYESTYSLEGMMSNPVQVNPIAPEDSDTALTSRIGKFQALYLEMIRRRVEYLLKELTRFIRNSGSAVPATNSDNGSTGNATGIYSINQTFALSQNLSISATVSNQDYFSPEQTAQRIVQFALSFYDGSDRAEYIDMVKSAVMKGYDEARAALGGYLLSIADDTLALAMKALENFAAGNPVDYAA